MAQLAISTRLTRARGFQRLLMVLEGSGWTAAVLLGAFLCLFHLDRILVLDIQTRIIAWTALGIAFAALVLRLILKPILGQRGELDTARYVETRYPELRERLLAAVSFASERDDERMPYSRTLIDDLTRDAENAAGALDFEAAFPRRGVRRAGTAVGIAAGVLALHFILAGPAFADQPQGFALIDIVRYPINRLHDTFLGVEVGSEVFDLEQLGHWASFS